MFLVGPGIHRVTSAVLPNTRTLGSPCMGKKTRPVMLFRVLPEVWPHRKSEGSFRNGNRTCVLLEMRAGWIHPKFGHGTKPTGSTAMAGDMTQVVGRRRSGKKKSSAETVPRGSWLIMLITGRIRRFWRDRVPVPHSGAEKGANRWTSIAKTGSETQTAVYGV